MLSQGGAAGNRHPAAQGHKRPMQSRTRGSAARHVTTAGLAIVTVIACAGAVSTWRYQNALSRASDAVSSNSGARITSALDATFWQERVTAEHYLINPSPRALRLVDSLQATFDGLTGQLALSAAPDEQIYLHRAILAERHYYAQFTSQRGGADRYHTYLGLQPAFAAAGLLNAAAAKVPPLLDTLDSLQVARGASAASDAAASKGQALTVGLLTIALTL